MECIKHDITAPCGQPINITIYSDLHKDSANADHKKIRKHMDARAALPGAVFVGIGDFLDNILPNDLKRSMPSAVAPQYMGYDAAIDKRVEEIAGEFRDYPWAMVGTGNHCLNVLKRHYTDPAARLAQALGCSYGGYSGMLRLYLNDPTKKKVQTRHNFTVLYHHGAWGGQSKGLMGAKRFGAAFEDWDLLAYGHNHQLHAHHETVLRMGRAGKLLERDRFIVNTGAFLRSYSNGGTPSYSEVRGYAPVALAAPLVTLTPRFDRLDVSVSLGDC